MPFFWLSAIYAQKVGDLYNIAMDSVKLNQEGVAPIKAELAAIDALKDKGEIYAYIAESQKKGIRPYFTMFITAFTAFCAVASS